MKYSSGDGYWAGAVLINQKRCSAWRDDNARRNDTYNRRVEYNAGRCHAQAVLSIGMQAPAFMICEGGAFMAIADMMKSCCYRRDGEILVETIAGLAS